MPIVALQIDEHKHAYRLNGITFAKRHLRELFPKWGDSKQTFFRFLVIMPFLAECKEVRDCPTATGKYAVAKCKRMRESLHMPEEGVIPFMMITAELGNIGPENFPDIMDSIHDHVCDCGKPRVNYEERGENIVDLRKYTRDGRTVH